jgi:steroid 5-alpha reductase family enzyme
VGAIVWAIGFGFEAIGDWQLARFKADPANRGSVMDKGLWRYTRHPNYFGDALLWWGLFIIAAGTSSGLFTIISPIIMTVLLVRVSGVALLERSQVRAKPGYQAYIARTSPFVPWFPRRDKVSHRVA